MDSIKSYLLSLISAAVICSIISIFIKKDSAYGSAIKIMCGVFLLVTAISPVLRVQIHNFTGYWDDLHSDANFIIENSEADAFEEACNIIKAQSEAYILDKASLLGLDVKVVITLNDTVPPSPYIVEIKGAVSPYLKQKLQKIILDDLAIPEERQIWA